MLGIYPNVEGLAKERSRKISTFRAYANVEGSAKERSRKISMFPERRENFRTLARYNIIRSLNPVRVFISVRGELRVSGVLAPLAVISRTLDPLSGRTSTIFRWASATAPLCTSRVGG
ncbi:hypothetical protein O3G_MSEX005398 [Manduca sexta]|uniref:Uncharacterized protein n=1 Tax=Manduca sexta TaxID=7130 RepID=A0A921YYI7_MANSE|nr:hypothetical protein O3G_MSEX005398 [Manduca sexta]